MTTLKTDPRDLYFWLGTDAEDVTIESIPPAEFQVRVALAQKAKDDWEQCNFDFSA